MKPGPKARPRPQPDATMPKMPRNLPTAARQLWKTIAPQLNELGLLTEVDGPAFTALCLHWAAMVEASNSLKADGVTTLDERGLPRKNPAMQILRDNSAAFRQWCQLFGLTPSSRTRLPVDGPGQKTLADLLFDAINE